MKTFLQKLGVQNDELDDVLRLFFLFAGYVFALLLGRSVRDSLFLNAGLSKSLPLMYVGVAGAVVGSTMLYKKLPKSSVPEVNARSIAGFFGISFIFVYGALQTSAREPAVYFLYFWVEILTAFLMIQFWGIANNRFTPRQAKRLYSLITSGQVAGNLACGFVASVGTAYFGTDVLLVLVAVALLATTAISAQPKQKEAATSSAPTQTKSLRKASLEARQYGWLLIALTVITYVTASLVDYQFKLGANTRYSGDALTQFFGSFYGIVGAAAFFVQVLLANRLVNWFGLFGTLSIMPGLFAIMGGARAMVHSFWLQVGLKFDEHLLRYSVNDPLSQMLLIPLPAQVKAALQQTLGGLVKPLAIGGSGLIMLAVATANPDNILRAVGAVIACMAILWIGILVAIRRRYVIMVSQAAESALHLHTDLSKLRTDSATRHIERVLTSKKVGDAARKVALDLVEELDIPVSLEVLEKYIREESSDYVLRARCYWILALRHYEEFGRLPFSANLNIPDDIRYSAMLLESQNVPQKWKERVLLEADPAALMRLLQVSSKSSKMPTHFRSSILDAAIDRLREAGLTDNSFGELARLVPDEELFSSIQHQTQRYHKENFTDTEIRFLERLFNLATQMQVAPNALKAEIAPILNGDIRSLKIAMLRWAVSLKETETLRQITANPVQAVENSAVLAMVWGSASRENLDAELQRLQQKQIRGAIEWETWTRPYIEQTSWPKLQVESELVQQWIEEANQFNLTSDDQQFNVTVAYARASRLALALRIIAMNTGQRDLGRVCHPALLAQTTMRAHITELVDQLVSGEMQKLLLSALEMNATSISNVQQAATELPWSNREKMCLHIFNTDLPLEDEEQMEVIERIMNLASVDLFQNMPLQSLAKVAEITEVADFSAGSSIIEDGATGDSLYLLTKGRVDVRKGEKSLVQLDAGVCFGEMAILDDQPRSADVLALEDSECLRIWRADFEVLIHDEPMIGRSIMQVLTQRLRNANTQ